MPPNVLCLFHKFDLIYSWKYKFDCVFFFCFFCFSFFLNFSDWSDKKRDKLTVTMSMASKIAALKFVKYFDAWNITEIINLLCGFLPPHRIFFPLQQSEGLIQKYLRATICLCDNVNNCFESRAKSPNWSRKKWIRICILLKWCHFEMSQIFLGSLEINLRCHQIAFKIMHN